MQKCATRKHNGKLCSLICRYSDEALNGLLGIKNDKLNIKIDKKQNIKIFIHMLA